MALTPIYTCDGCDKQRQDSNHWLAIVRKGSSNTIHPSVEIRAFDDSGPDHEHYCGVQCCLKAVAAFMDSLMGKQVALEEQVARENTPGACPNCGTMDNRHSEYCMAVGRDTTWREGCTCAAGYNEPHSDECKGKK